MDGITTILIRIITMGFTTSCFIRKNSEELQKKLSDMGYDICPCANFEDAVWLDTLPMNGTVHGVGYFDSEIEYTDCTIEKELKRFISENPEKIDCGINEDLFFAIAALRDDSDKNQWFVSYDGEYVLCDQSELKHVIDNDNSYEEYCVSDFHKATVEELIKHFTK
jgi:hypothetical protein